MFYDRGIITNNILVGNNYRRRDEAQLHCPYRQQDNCPLIMDGVELHWLYSWSLTVT